MADVEHISLADLAVLLGVEPDRLPPLIFDGYLNVVISGNCANTIILERPPVKTLTWLRRFMLVPLSRRPFLPFKDIAKLLHRSARGMREYCQGLNIMLYVDPVFGELISIDDFYALQKHLYDLTHPIRTDRGALLSFLGSLRVSTQEAPIKGAALKRYSLKINKEVQRIASLPEPMRTLRATDLWMAFKDVEAVADCIGKDPATTRKALMQDVLTRRMRDTKAIMEGVDLSENNTFYVPGKGRINRAVQSKAVSVAMTAYWKRWREKKALAEQMKKLAKGS